MLFYSEKAVFLFLHLLFIETFIYALDSIPAAVCRKGKSAGGLEPLGGKKEVFHTRNAVIKR
jgi:hypothetical protein